MNDHSLNTATLEQLAQVKGQLMIITQMIQSNHTATHTRIDDLRHAVEGRIQGIESRVEKIEGNERGTAIRTSAVGALSGALSSAIVAATLRAISSGHG